ncbi:hypothetical protein Y032_0071g598 [Ancylostoma ceylanicum]|uniref:Uncharacterized protein n=1 Tax=Ancylostoma ceylanicum TaxID=53326 RepID=A0A016TXH4_9BILA|nr:hypothetical protein Y032_0071g598 [Ancylostoma ceylanicum]
MRTTAATCAILALIYGIWSAVDTIFLAGKKDSQGKELGFFTKLLHALLDYILFLIAGLSKFFCNHIVLHHLEQNAVSGKDTIPNLCLFRE